VNKEAFMKKILILAAIALPLLVFAEEETIGYLGVITEELSETMMTALDVENGLLIKDVVENSPAEKAGLETGDVIIEIDGDKIVDYATLKGIIAAKPDKKVKILIKREGKKHTKEAKLSSRLKPKFNVQMELPDFEEIKELMSKGSKEIMQEIDNLKEEIQKLKQELEDLKKKVG
jgi:C-terminal processing protease CtpA/Prc